MSAEEREIDGTKIAFLLGTLDTKMTQMMEKFQTLIEGESGILVRVRQLEDYNLKKDSHDKGVRVVLGFLGTGLLTAIGLLLKLLTK